MYYISSIELTTYEALEEQWGRFYKSGSYFALFEIFDEVSANSKKWYRFRIQRYNGSFKNEAWEYFGSVGMVPRYLLYLHQIRG
jgi:hypothetical protein